jgi:hypothetical protein
MNPYITLAIAEQRNADMRARAAARTLTKAVKVEQRRSRVQRLRAADCPSEMPRESDSSAAARPMAHSGR